EPAMKHPRDPDKHKEYHKRKHESDEDDLTSDIHDLRIACNLDAGATELGEEADDVVQHEENSYAFCAQGGEMLCVEGADDSTQDHVDRCCDERWCAENEHLLEGPGTYQGSVVVGPGAAVVAECLAWNMC
ncbi:hypothetical protein APSETT445_006312, partial [Aspergillus pseudonomiae]